MQLRRSMRQDALDWHSALGPNSAMNGYVGAGMRNLRHGRARWTRSVPTRRDGYAASPADDVELLRERRHVAARVHGDVEEVVDDQIRRSVGTDEPEDRLERAVRRGVAGREVLGAVVDAATEISRATRGRS